MSFLEYILSRYLGRPTSSRGGGVSYWPCPKCEHPSFHTMPLKEGFKHRARCWSSECDFRGDAADMLKVLRPDLPNWSDRRDLLEQLRREQAPLVAGGESK